MSQLILKRQPEPVNKTVERAPVEEGTKLSTTSYPFVPSDLVGLTWVFSEKDW